jgi:hypothetical protein
MEQRLIMMLKDVKGVNLSSINPTINEENGKERMMPLYARNLGEEVEKPSSGIGEMDPYPATNIRRAYVPEGKKTWDVHYQNYKPVRYTSSAILNNSKNDIDLLK